MTCGSCRRPCDPNRSFCTHCGSSVFAEERDAASFFFGRLAPRVSLPASESRQLKAVRDSAVSLKRSVVVNAGNTLRSRNVPASTARLPFLPGTLIKLAILVFLIWYAAGWLLQVPKCAC